MDVFARAQDAGQMVTRAMVARASSNCEPTGRRACAAAASCSSAATATAPARVDVGDVYELVRNWQQWSTAAQRLRVAR